MPSGLWGCTGELWTPGGPLSDWSFAGYAAGEAAIPDAPVAIDVKRDHGATGDGKHDDTSAVLAALRAAAVRGGGVVYFPTGRCESAMQGKIKLCLCGYVFCLVFM